MDRAAFMALCVTMLGVACSRTPTAPSDPSSGLAISSVSGITSRWADVPRVSYTGCYSFGMPLRVETRPITIRKVEFTVLGPNNVTYGSAIQAMYTGYKTGGVNGGEVSGCYSLFDDFDLARPIGTQIRLSIEFVYDSGTPREVQRIERTGTVRPPF